MITSNQQNELEVSESGQESDLVQDSLFAVIWRGRWIVLLSVLLTLTFGFVYVMKATPIFTSSSRIYVEQTGPRIIEDFQGVMTQSKNYLYTQAELMKSTPIISETLDQQGIRQMMSFADVDNPLAFLKKKLNVSVGKKDDIISVEFDSAYPAEASMLINAIVDSYITYHSTRKKTTSTEVLNILKREKTKAETELNTKRDKMLQFQKDNPALTFESRQGNIVIERLAMLSESLTSAEIRTVQAKSIFETIKLMVDDPSRLKQYIDAQRTGYYAFGSQESERKKLQLDQAELEFAEKCKDFTDDHPLVMALKNKINTLRDQITEFEKNFATAQVAVANQDYLMAKENEDQIRAYFEKQRDEAMDLNEKLTEFVIFRSDADRAENLIEILDDRIKEINVTEDTGALNISILEYARPAVLPSKPQKARILAMSLVLGFMVGGGLALVRDWMDTRLRSADEISSILNVPVLGTVPSMDKRAGISDRGMIVFKKSASPISEAYRSIRTAVFFGVPDGGAKTMLVTSPAPGEGKTTLVSNMAISMAQSDQRTLIIDADFRKPMQHNIFGLDVEMGLSAVLAGRAELADCLQSTDVKNLTVLPAGPEIVNPSEMLNSEAFARMLKQFRNDFDRVIIDSPPVMPVTDSRIIGAQTDITLLVVRANKSTRRASQQARDGLLSVNAGLLGVVVNDVSKQDGRYGYYSGHGYYGSYYGKSGGRSKISESGEVKI
ncbi:MAG: polysaccharide biosynthesis tyrosine autokinase [Anaerohalosphaera sp.]|nr:polysaccharide biosynthesis tyrosine autokinase [Anaerohalosphaera sp.]